MRTCQGTATLLMHWRWWWSQW